MNDLIK